MLYYLVHLEMRPEVAEGYKSPAQRARVITETWVSENMYCPGCDSDSLEALPKNTRVADFICASCEDRFQLKSQSKPFGNRVLDSAYEPMMQAILAGKVPNLLLMHYRLQVWRVHDFLAVPSFFLSPSSIERRPPLKSSARRAGWVGCNIVLRQLPPDARISVVDGGRIAPAAEVREQWRSFSFLKEQKAETRGWLADVLTCVRRIGKPEFTLADVYAFEGELERLHPANRHVRDKIRQQLQMLRDSRTLIFVRRGVYQLQSGHHLGVPSGFDGIGASSGREAGTHGW